MRYLAALLMVSACYSGPSINPFEESAYDLCRMELEKTLVAPSSLKIVSRTFNDREPWSFEEGKEHQAKKTAEQEANFANLSQLDRVMLAYATSPKFKKERDAMDRQLKASMSKDPTGFVLLEYDAVNRANAPIRSNFFCRVGRPVNGELTRRWSSVFDSGEVSREDADDHRSIVKQAKPN